jgi:hypothetical protein
MKLFTTKAQLVAAIEDIRSTGKKFDNMVHVAGVSVLAEIEKSGNTTMAVSLLDAMPKGSRSNALIGFMEKFGKVRFDADTKKLVFAKTKETDIAGAMETSWVEFKPEPPYHAMTVEGALASLINKANKRAAEGDERDDINAGRLATLADIVAAWAETDTMLANTLAAEKAASEDDPLAQAPVTLETA